MIQTFKTKSTAQELKRRLQLISHVALDMDGTIYNGKTMFDFTTSFLRELKEMGLSYSFLTNNPSRSVADYIDHLEGMGIQACKEEIYTSALATIDYLKSHCPDKKRLFILGTPSMIGEFEAAGFISLSDSPDEQPDAVVVSFDTTLSYPRLSRAAWWIAQDVFYLATNPDHVCPTDDLRILPDCGSICAALEQATKRKPDVVLGKPDPNMLWGIIQQRHLQPENVAMVGDRIYTDMMMALKAEVFSVLVLSGETSLREAEKMTSRPSLIVKDLEVFGNLLLDSQSR